jgi:hypothetical protein
MIIACTLPSRVDNCHTNPLAVVRARICQDALELWFDLVVRELLGDKYNKIKIKIN